MTPCGIYFFGAAAPVAPFALVFVDPPYGKGLAEPALASALEGGWLTDEALIIVEESAGVFKTPDGFEEIERRQYDDTEFTILRRKAERHPGRSAGPIRDRSLDAQQS